MKLWLFSPDLSMSSSAWQDGKPVKVAKILWQDCKKPSAAAEQLNSRTLQEKEIQLPQWEFDELRSLLESSAQALWRTGRHFQDWHVGLLERFTSADIAG